MATTTTIGVSVKNPAHGREGYTLQAVDIGAFQEMADGSVVFDYVTTKLLFSFKWVGLTLAEKGVIYARYIIKTAQTVKPPDTATTYNAIVVPNSWREDYQAIGGGTDRYWCEMQLRQV